MNNQTYTDFLNKHKRLIKQNKELNILLNSLISEVEKVRIEVKRINNYE